MQGNTRNTKPIDLCVIMRRHLCSNNKYIGSIVNTHVLVVGSRETQKQETSASSINNIS